MGRRTVRHKDIRRKRRSEKEESIEKEKLGQRGDHPTRNGPESFLYCPRLWRSSTGFLNRNSLSQRGYGVQAGHATQLSNDAKLKRRRKAQESSDTLLPLEPLSMMLPGIMFTPRATLSR